MLSHVCPHRFTCEVDRQSDSQLPFTFRSHAGPLRPVVRALACRTAAVTALSVERRLPNVPDWTWPFSAEHSLSGLWCRAGSGGGGEAAPTTWQPQLQDRAGAGSGGGGSPTPIGPVGVQAIPGSGNGV